MSRNDVAGEPSPYLQAVAVRFGFIISIMMEAGLGHIDLRSIYAWCLVPIRIGNVAFTFDQTGSPIGFATWAYVSKRTSERLRSGECDFLQHEDWNDGDELWLIDFFALHGRARQLVSALIERLGPRFTEASYCRRKPNGFRRCRRLALRRHGTGRDAKSPT